MSNEDLFVLYPALREVIESIPRARLRGVAETIGPNVTPLDAYEGGRGLLEVPDRSTETSTLVRPDDFAEWIRAGFSRVDPSEGCFFWVSIHRPGHKGFPWIEVEIDSFDTLLPLWFTLRAQVVIVFVPSDYCILAYYEADIGWEFFRE